MKSYKCVIIGGGSAGLACAIQLKKLNIESLLIEKEEGLGGILNQCIHNGFGLTRFKEELTGPSYAERLVSEFIQLGIEYQLESTVIHLNPDKTIEYINPNGVHKIQAESIVLALGARERTRGNIMIPGDRSVGVWTAGSAQKYLNMDGYCVGKRVFILGSGDIGLIMARRLTIAKAKVVGVAEIMPYSNGLTRNLVQCLYDFDIPLHLSTTITKINGKQRVESIELSRVDENLKPIVGTEFNVDVDAVLLSVGLIPDNIITEEAGIVMDPQTKGPRINHNYETSIPGIFACGNGLHIHDVVDFVSEEGDVVAKSVSDYLNNVYDSLNSVEVKGDTNFIYVIPHTINLDKTVKLKFRMRRPFKNVKILIKSGDEILMTLPKTQLLPAEMEMIQIPLSILQKVKDKLTLECIQ
ncbi:MAG TPA: NAD(P)/FAD-dependent oxidoreductase [Erysipelotrichaceae bacterium]|nr:NAD(P)/FAD-dependent oxidoreductase [Erysipelotrichaceae bacterium]